MMYERSDLLRRALGGVDADLIEAADESAARPARTGWVRWAAAAAVVLLLGAALTLPRFLEAPRGVPAETAPDREYRWRVEDGRYAAYVPGRVIEEARVGERLGAVTVTAGWTARGEAVTAERLRAEVCAIRGVDADVAVCVRFLDPGDALTTTHYYTLLNPAADTTPVQAYRIRRESGTAPDGSTEE